VPTVPKIQNSGITSPNIMTTTKIVNNITISSSHSIETSINITEPTLATFGVTLCFLYSNNRAKTEKTGCFLVTLEYIQYKQLFK
ncbi:MAG: hypothetical protein WCK00_05505, partial [Deltaproteobacteria bacterium]